MSFYRRLVVGTSLVCLSVAAPAFAARPARGNGDAIKNKVQDVLDRTDALAQNLDALCNADCQASPAGQRLKAKIDRVKRSHARVKAAHSRSAGADFQDLVRKRPHKKSDSPCDPELQVCLDTAVAITADPTPEFDEERGKDMIEDLQEVSDDVDELNQLLAGHLPAPPPPDITLENAEYFFPSSAWPSSELTFGAFIASQVAQKASAVLSHGCDQTVVALGFGGNTAAACMVIEGVFQTLDAVYQVMDYIGNDVMASEVNGAYRRAKNIFDQLALTNGDVEQTKAVVQAIGEKMLVIEEQNRQILEMLRTPQGKRPGFPTLTTTTTTTAATPATAKKK